MENLKPLEIVFCSSLWLFQGLRENLTWKNSFHKGKKFCLIQSCWVIVECSFSSRKSWWLYRGNNQQLPISKRVLRGYTALFQTDNFQERKFLGEISKVGVLKSISSKGLFHLTLYSPYFKADSLSLRPP